MKTRILILSAAALGLAALLFLALPPAAAPDRPGAAPPKPNSTTGHSAQGNAPGSGANVADIARTMDEALSIGDAAARRAAVAEVAIRWLNTDRMTFVAFLEETEVAELSEEAGTFARLLPGLADAFPAVDESAASSPVYNDAIQKFVELWAAADPASALAWVDQWLLGDSRDQAAATLVGAVEDSAEAQKILDSIQQPYRRVEGTTAMATRRAEEDPDAAFAWATSRATALEKTVAIEKTLSTLAATHPRKAADFLALHASAINAEAAVALARLPTTPEPPQFRPRPGLDDAEPELTPQESIEARRRDQLARFAGAATAIASGLATTDPAAARNWAATLPEGPVRQAAQDAALAAGAAGSPADALFHFLETKSASPRVAASIFAEWARTDAATATVRIAEVPEPAARVAAAEGLAGAWAESEPSAARAWADARADARERDAALGGYARSVSERDPAAAWDGAWRIADATLRHEVLAEIFPDVVADDPARASALLASANLPPESARRLQRQVDGALKTTR